MTTDEIYNTLEKETNFNETKLASTITENYTIGAEEAAQILCVNRSRLSQLTSKGVFSFERRKIGTHNRLFYKLNEILSHQRAQTYGNVQESSSHLLRMKSLEHEKFDPILPDIQTEKTESKIEETFLFKEKKLYTNKNFPSAKETTLSEQNIQKETHKINIIEKTYNTVQNYEENLNQFKLTNSKEFNNFIKNNKENRSKSFQSLSHSIYLINKKLEEIDKKLDFILNKKTEDSKFRKRKTKAKPKYMPHSKKC